MNKRRSCLQCSFTVASCCLGKARWTSAATHPLQLQVLFFPPFFAARRRLAASTDTQHVPGCGRSVCCTGKMNEGMNVTPDTLHCTGSCVGLRGMLGVHWICCIVQSSLIRWEKLWQQLFIGKTHQGACCVTIIKWSQTRLEDPILPTPPTIPSHCTAA